MSNISLFSSAHTDSTAVTLHNASGKVTGSFTVEGAIVKGGKALAAIKDEAVRTALAKAEQGRYRPACEVSSTGFGKLIDNFTNVTGAQPWANKANAVLFFESVLRQPAGKSGTFSKTQIINRHVASLALDKLSPESEALAAARTV